MSEDYKYPLKMMAIPNGVVVNMTAEGVGTVIGTGQAKAYDIGYHGVDWYMLAFKPYIPIILKTKG